MYHEIGPRWVAMCDILPGRSGNDIKNRWHKHLRKLDIFEIPDEREEEDNQEIFSSKIDDDSSDPLYISEKMNSYNEENDILKDMSINDDDIQELLNCFDENPSEMNE
ncbi:hypothetical protein TRFO_02824 [Tritrichomonas foetus]|uniref:Uncharacterized protein n=1 Tax=Tritrichomonas foetus TaxID=1144522 RepID=A0A1J4KWH1_9EUKA|nr:hypothetical protein TRFO_02824 [Tritrichomonas foetus]|eukprot:OHT15506.1 hypothetical protein TRFO_02824 [Tritrichomonas foetus]